MNGVDWRGFAGFSAWMMCQPNWVLIGFESSPVASAKAVLSNSGTVWPRVIVSSPPWDFEPGSIEYFFASVAKSAPPFSSAYSLSASALSFAATRMWRTTRVCGVV